MSKKKKDANWQKSSTKRPAAQFLTQVQSGTGELPCLLVLKATVALLANRYGHSSWVLMNLWLSLLRESLMLYKRSSWEGRASLMKHQLKNVFSGFAACLLCSGYSKIQMACGLERVDIWTSQFWEWGSQIKHQLSSTVLRDTFWPSSCFLMEWSESSLGPLLIRPLNPFIILCL